MICTTFPMCFSWHSTHSLFVAGLSKILSPATRYVGDLLGDGEPGGRGYSTGSRCSIISPAFLVAASIEVRRAPCSLATLSHKAPSTTPARYSGIDGVKHSSAVRLIERRASRASCPGLGRGASKGRTGRMEAVWVSMETNWVNAMRISSNSPAKNFWQTRREISKQSLTRCPPPPQTRWLRSRHYGARNIRPPFYRWAIRNNPAPGHRRHLPPPL